MKPNTTSMINCHQRVPDSLYQICIRRVSKSIKQYKDTGDLQSLPSEIKNRLIKLITRVYCQFQDEDLLKLLLNKNLMEIDFYGWQFTNKSLINLSSLSQYLKVLRFPPKAKGITLDCLMESLSKLTRLEELYMKYLKVLNDDVIECLAKSCPNLTVLNVEGCAMITDKSIRFIKTLNIKQLSLAHTQITNEGLDELANSSCGQILVDLNVSHTKVTGEGLAKLPGHTLKFVFFDGCKVDDLTQLKFAKYVKYMQFSISFND